MNMGWEDIINDPWYGKDRQTGGVNRKEGRTLLPEDQQLLTGQQLRVASGEQLQDLIARVDVLPRSKGQPGLTLRPPED